MPSLSRLALAGLLAATVLLGARTARADDPPAGDKEKKAEAAPETVVAEKGKFVVWVESTGTFEPVDPVEISLEPELWGGEWKVVEATKGPLSIEAGQTLVRFDTDKIDEALAYAEKDLEIAGRALDVRREDGKRAEAAASLAMTKTVEDKAAADEALKFFVETDRDLRTHQSEHWLQGSKDNIQDQEEELAQLKKMYKADDVVEETEEIVLKRAERSLARSKTWLGFQTLRHQALVELELPREHKNLDLAARRAAFDLDRLKATQASSLEQGRIDLAKAEVAMERQKVSFERLKGDRARFVVKAPVAGFAVPGGFSHGKWSGIEDAGRALLPGKTVGARQPLWTIVGSGVASFRTSVPEASVLTVRPGQPVEIASTALPESPLQGKVERVVAVGNDGNHDVLVTLTSPEPRLMPGFSGKSKTKTSEKADAVTVPSGCIVVDGEKKTVQVLGDGGKPVPREVKVGAVSGGRTEILEGLAGGEKVVKAPAKP